VYRVKIWRLFGDLGLKKLIYRREFIGGKKGKIRDYSVNSDLKNRILE